MSATKYPTTAAEPSWLDSQQAAAYIGRNLKYLRRLVAQRRVAFYRLPGGHLRFAVADLDEFMHRYRVERLPW